MTQRNGYARRHYASVFTVLAALLGVLLCVCCACAPMSDTAIGHSYSQKNAQEYFPRDDDGDIKDAQVDFISPDNSSSIDTRDVARVADALTKHTVPVRYRRATTQKEQIAQVRLAIRGYAKLICIPVDAVTVNNASEWNSVLARARSRSIAVAFIAGLGNQSAISQVKKLITKRNYAAIWMIDSAHSHMGSFDVIMTIIEDKPHGLMMYSTLR